MTGAAPPLSLQLRHAAACVQAVESGRSLSDALPRVPSVVRPGVQALVFHTLRHLGVARAVLACLVNQPPAPVTGALLRVAVTLLLDPLEPTERSGSTGPEGTPHYDAHTVVDQAVDCMNALRPSQSGLVNACLRRFLRERADLLTRVRSDWEARYNHPAWWVKRLRRDHPQHWQAILAAGQHPAALVLRAHTPNASRQALLEALVRQGIAVRPTGERARLRQGESGIDDGIPPVGDALIVDRPGAVEALPGYAAGWFAVQDWAAQCAAPLLMHGLLDQLTAAGRDLPTADRPLRILDACAAPGGKTAHLLAQAQAYQWPIEVVALDVDAKRVRRITENLTRLRGQAQVQVADASQPALWWDGRGFDAILLDAPCSATGIVRRHPDVRWLRREADVAALAEIQRRMLDALWPLLNPGGRLVYATCSVFKAEGADQAVAFQSRHSDAVPGPSPGHLLPLLASVTEPLADNAPCEHDGFFYARWEKLSR